MLATPENPPKLEKSSSEDAVVKAGRLGLFVATLYVSPKANLTKNLCESAKTSSYERLDPAKLEF